MINVLAFLFIYFFICNWFQLVTIISAFLGKKVEKTKVKDKWIYRKIFEKTGLKLNNITLYKDKRMYGMMVGIPSWPQMILSEGLYKNLNKDELEWVLLHETAHCVLWHNLKAAFYQFIFASTGIYLIYVFELNIAISFLMALLLSIICIQLIRWLIEYQADKFSIERVDDPSGVISAQEIFKKANANYLFNSEKSIGKFFLTWNIYPSKRIEMAKTRLFSN